MQQAFAYCAELVRAHERDRYLASLYAPAERRPALHALYAFDHELACVGERVREPLAGEVRLQWWREVLDGRRAEEAAANPVAAALLAALGQGQVPRRRLAALIDARAFDVHAEPMATLAQFDAYGQDTAGAVIEVAALLLGAAAGERLGQAAEHTGAATAGVEALARFAAHASRRRLYVPLELLERHRAGLADVFAGRATAELRAALAEMRGHVRHHVRCADDLAAQLDARVRPAFLHVMLAPLALDLMDRPGYDPFKTGVEVPQWRRQWRLWRAARAAPA